MTEKEFFKAQKLIQTRKAIISYERALSETDSPLFWPEFAKMKEAFQLVLNSLYDVEKSLLAL